MAEGRIVMNQRANLVGNQNPEYSMKGIRMDKKADSLTKRFIVENAEYSLESPFHHWRAWICKQIVFLAVSGSWQSRHYPYYFGKFWDIFCERKKAWDKVCFVVDANNMPIQSEGFRGYVNKNWSHIIEREDFCLCIVESSAMKRAIWKSIYSLLGVQNKVHLFSNHDQAIQWAQEQRSVSSNKAAT